MLKTVQFNKKLIPKIGITIRHLSTPAQAFNENNVISTEIEYPEIEDLSTLGKKKKTFLMSCKEIETLPTIEEKLIKVNMPRYYGWRPVMFDESKLHYNILPCAQYTTKTHLVPERKLPTCYDHIIDPGTINQLITDIKGQIEDVLIFEHMERRRNDISLKDSTDEITLEKIKTKSIIQQINRIIMNNLSENYLHLMESEMEYDPRLEAFWTIGGIPPPTKVVEARKKSWYKDYADEPLNVYIQYIGEPLLQLRHYLPLREIISLEESEDSALNVPDFKYNPRNLGYHTERRHVTNIPGFWPGDQNEFGILSYHHRSHMLNRSMDDNNEALIAQAILASFGWLMTQACYQGFSPFNDITYPLINQMAITNGQLWSFFTYQLNTTVLNTYALRENQKRNICWATEPMKLYDSIENGQIHGFNDDVLKHLLKFYINVPEQRDYNTKPYLGENTQVIAQYEEEEKRKWLEERFKHLMSLRDRHEPLPEILQWQKIFMLDNKTRPMDKKREPWEFGINPYHRKLNEHLSRYIPKCLRPHPKKKYKWEAREKTYYP